MPFTPEQHREHYTKNRDKIILHQKEYYQHNKGKIQGKTLCPLCFAVVSKSYLKNHQKTYKCQINRYHPIKPLYELPRKSKTD